MAGNGDPAWFVRKMISLAPVSNRDDPHKLHDIFFGTEIRTRHSNNFTNTFAKLENAAKAVDQDDMVTDALVYGSAGGMLYRIIRSVRGEEVIDSLLGFTRPASTKSDSFPAPGTPC